MEVTSRSFLGQRYQSNPLIGSAETAEVFTIPLDRFDCVTYVETVVALAHACDADDFTDCVRQIRYKRGQIEWKRRNHYMTDWIQNNLRSGIIREVPSPPVPTVCRERVLNVVPGLAPRPARIQCVPKNKIRRLEPYLQSGDLIFFVSTRKNLDIFHAGIIVREGAKLLMRHASRSQGLVVEQELNEFLKGNRMAGVIAVRPKASEDASPERNRTIGSGRGGK